MHCEQRSKLSVPEQNKEKGGAGRVILIILVIIAVLGTAGFLGLRAYIADKLGQIKELIIHDQKRGFRQQPDPRSFLHSNPLPNIRMRMHPSIHSQPGIKSLRISAC